MKRKSLADKLINARINKAISGLLIPVLQISTLDKLLREAIARDEDDAQLFVRAHAFIYGNEAK